MSQEQPPVRSRRELRQSRDGNQVAGPPAPGQLSPASKQRRVSDTPVDSVPEQSPAQRSSQIRARDRAALRTIKELEEKEGQLSAGGPPTRRQLRLQQLKEQAVTSANPIISPAGPQSGPVKPGGGPAGKQSGPGKPGGGPAGKTSPAVPTPGSGVPAGMSVEQALAARSLIAEQAKNQLAKMEHIASLDPEAVDPDILAEQIALAERAAILNRRAMAKQKLAEQAEPPASTQGSTTSPRPASPPAGRPGPATAANLAMVTPLEFVQVPGIDRPVMKPSATSHVPVVTQPGQKVRTGGKGRRPSAAAKQAPAGSAPAVPSGRSRVIARAEAAARAAAEPKRVAPVLPDQPVGESDDLFDDLPRIPASSAHGLEPLDAATAGLARAKRLRLMQVLVLVFGIVALISGVILIISGISR